MIDRLFLAFVRETLADKRHFKSVASYLSKTAKGNLQQDLENLKQDLRDKKNNALADAFTRFLSIEAAEILDGGSEKLPKSPLGNALKATLHKYSTDAFARQTSLFLADFNRPTVYVQSASELDAKVKSKIRTAQSEAYVIFSIEKNLLGGIRAVKAGTIYDATWNSLLKKILKASYAK